MIDIEESVCWIGFEFHRLLFNPYCDNRQQATASVCCWIRFFLGFRLYSLIWCLDQITIDLIHQLVSDSGSFLVSTFVFEQHSLYEVVMLIHDTILALWRCIATSMNSITGASFKLNIRTKLNLNPNPFDSLLNCFIGFTYNMTDNYFMPVNGILIHLLYYSKDQSLILEYLSNFFQTLMICLISIN